MIIRLIFLLVLSTALTSCTTPNIYSPNYYGYDGAVYDFGKVTISLDTVKSGRYRLKMHNTLENKITSTDIIEQEAELLLKIENGPIYYELSLGIPDQSLVSFTYDRPKSVTFRISKSDGEIFIPEFEDSKIDFEKLKPGFGEELRKMKSKLKKDMSPFMEMFKEEKTYHMGDIYKMKGIEDNFSSLNSDEFEVLDAKTDGKSIIIGLTEKDEKTYVIHGHYYTYKIKGNVEGQTITIKMKMTGYTGEAIDGSGLSFTKWKMNSTYDGKTLFNVASTMELTEE